MRLELALALHRACRKSGVRLPALALGAGHVTHVAGVDDARSGALILQGTGPASSRRRSGRGIGRLPGRRRLSGRLAGCAPWPGRGGGRLHLWTPLLAGADPVSEWQRQAVPVAGFGTVRGMAQ